MHRSVRHVEKKTASTRGDTPVPARTRPGTRYTALDGVVGGLIGGILVGMMIHMALSMMFGVSMALIGWRLPRQVVVRAVVLSLILWSVTNYLVLPIIDQTFYDRFPAWIFAIGHAIYGLGVGSYLASQRARAGG